MFSKTSRLVSSFSVSRAQGFATAVHSPICILGGGCAGVNVSAQLLHKGVLPQHIRIFEPSKFHHYQPGWTSVGGGLTKPENVVDRTENMLPSKVPWTPIGVSNVDPETRIIETEDGSRFSYDQLIIATGIRTDFDAIKGLTEAINDPQVPVGSIYHYRYTQKWAHIRENFQGQTAVFTQAPQPIKCAGAPQKILHLSHDYWAKKNISPKLSFYSAAPAIFSQPDYGKALQSLADQKGFDVHLQHNLAEVRGKDRVAVFKDKDQNNVEVSFDALHVTPYMKPQEFISRITTLVDGAGFVDVDPITLQSTRYNNVWSLGDAANLPTSKTAAAVLAQTPVLVNNLLKVWREDASRGALAGYFGYTACPIFVGNNKLLLAEFKYNCELDETFPNFQKSKKPSSLFYLLKTKVFPFAYFNLMPRGFWYGRSGPFPPELQDVNGKKY